VGLTAEELAFLCKDIKMQQDPDDEEKEIPVLDDKGQPVYGYSLRYEEYIAIMAEKIKRQEKTIKDLEQRISVLEK
jgi:hypothetical protein